MLEEIYLKDCIARFRELKVLAEKAIAQISDEQLFQTADEESNSIAIIMKHVSGNLKSRWSDFLTTDGEKPDRNRDSEFEMSQEDTRTKLMDKWESGWKILFDTLDSLHPPDLVRIVKIRERDHYVVEAINRQILHYGLHIGQIVFLAKFFASSNWKTLSIPRKKH